MSKMKLLLDVIADLRSLADSLQAVSDAMEGNEPTVPCAPIAEQAEAPPITLEQVRAVLALKSQDGLGAEVRTLLQKHGAEKLSAVDPMHYAALLADAEALGHG